MKSFFTAVLVVLLVHPVQAQNVAINNSNTAPHASAMLDVQSTTKGMLVPRMTTSQRNAISNPAQGLLVYDTDLASFIYFNGTAWTAIGSGGAAGGVFTVTNGQVHNTGNISTNNFVFGRTALPQSNEGVEDKFMFFQKDKGALRSGMIVGEEFHWSPENIGLASVALGNNNLASASSSVALGANNKATGTYATALGYFTRATANSSTSIGNNSTASGVASIAGGLFTRANGLASIALGENTTAHSFASMAIGRYNDSVTGSQTSAWVETDPLLTIGNGTSNENRRNALTLLKNGNMGLGINAPQTLMHLRKNSFTGFGQLILEESNDVQDGSRITFKNSGAPGLFWDLYGYTGAESELPGMAKFNFNVSGLKDIMTLTGMGHVGIGNNTPMAGLDITSNASSLYPQARLRVNTNDFVRLRMSNTVNANPYWDMASQTSGITPGNARMNFFYSHTGGAGTDILSLHGSGNAILAGALTQNSDARLKQNIEPIKDAASLISQLSGYHYQWKDDWREQGLQTGLLAQEVEKLMPELVKEDDKGVKSVNYNGLIPYLLEAIKAQQKQINALMQKMETGQ